MRNGPMMKLPFDNTPPFDPLMPNVETIAAIEAARRGELVTVGSPDNPIESLNSDPCPAS
jgi:DNA-damage-inducible protein J